MHTSAAKRKLGRHLRHKTSRVAIFRYTRDLMVFAAHISIHSLFEYLYLSTCEPEGVVQRLSIRGSKFKP